MPEPAASVSRPGSPAGGAPDPLCDTASPPSPWRSTLSWAVVVLCLGFLGYLLLRPGVLITRDMVVVDTPALSRDSLGIGDLPPRNTPQDGFLALAGMFLPASWVARFLILGGAALACWSMWSLGPAALLLTLCNPWTVSRLAQGQWSLVIAAWLLPGIVLARRSPHRQLGLVWCSSLTPTGALVASIVAVCTRPRWATAVGCVATWIPWLIPALWHAQSQFGVSTSAFHSRAETSAGLLPSLLSLGGIWNGAVARHGSFLSSGVAAGLLLFLLVVLGLGRLPRRLWVLAAVGILCAWWSPQLSWLPGHELFRDSHKFLLLALPAYVLAVAQLRGRILPVLCMAATLCAVPAAPQHLAELTPVTADPQWQQLAERAAGREVLVVAPPTAVTTYQGRVAVDPRSKAVAMVQPGQLLVDGQPTDPVNPRWQAAMTAYQSHQPDTATRLTQLGIGMVVDGSTVQLYPQVQPPRRWPGVVLILCWLGVPLVLSGQAARQKVRRWYPRRTP